MPEKKNIIWYLSRPGSIKTVLLACRLQGGDGEKCVTGTKTYIKLREQKSIGMWNIPVLHQFGKVRLTQLEQYRWDIARLVDVRWTRFRETTIEATNCGTVGRMPDTSKAWASSCIGRWSEPSLAVPSSRLITCGSARPHNVTIVQVYNLTSTHGNNKVEEF